LFTFCPPGPPLRANATVTAVIGRSRPGARNRSRIVGRDDTAATRGSRNAALAVTPVALTRPVDTPSMTAMRDNGSPRSEEWVEVQQTASELRRRLERMLRRRLVHDPRVVAERPHDIVAADLADEAFTWALENWKAKPATVTPEQWMRKRGLQLLDAALDREALAAEGRAESVAEERDAERRLLAHQLLRHDDGRAEWLDMAGMGAADSKADAETGEYDPFDGIACDPLVSSPAERLDERETLVALDRALLTLPEHRRKIVAHRYLDGLAVEEIAYLLDAPVPDVRAEIAAGIEDLRRAVVAKA
jgi:DNA-directed RNA polymerase specialized sigma24 family protein